MGLVSNPRKVFNFRIEIEGIDQAEFQTVQLPENGVDVVEHGGSNYKIKTGGLTNVGTLILGKLRALPLGDTKAWRWLNQIQNPDTGGGDLPSNYKRTIIIKEMNSFGTVAVNRWVYSGCFPSKISYNELSRTSSDNTIETLEISVDKVRQV